MKGTVPCALCAGINGVVMKEGKRDILFGREAFGGFKRRDVIAYIEQLQNDLTKKERECAQQKALIEEYQLLEQQRAEDIVSYSRNVDDVVSEYLGEDEAEEAFVAEEDIAEAAEDEAALEEIIEEAEAFEEDEAEAEVLCEATPLVTMLSQKAELQTRMQQLLAELEDSDGEPDGELMDQITDFRAQLTVEAVANEIRSEREREDESDEIDDGFTISVEDAFFDDEDEAAEEKTPELSQEQSMLDEIESIINRFLS